MLYVEGYSLDEFFKGNIRLQQVTSNKIGIIFDSAIPQNVLNVHINTINAIETVYGLNIIGYELTEEDVGVEFFIEKSGISTGNIKNLSTLYKAAQKLIKKGAEAIAIVCRFPDEQSDNYAKGIGVDPVGGVEAIISHYISKEFKLPCAHAPAFDDITISTEIVDKISRTKHVGVVGTVGTISSKSYSMEIAKLFPHIQVTGEACPLWVPLVETGEYNSPGADYFVKQHLDRLFLKDPQIDTLILGCTHYPLLLDKIRRYTPTGVTLLPQGEYVAESLADYLMRHTEMDARLTKQSSRRFLTTESAEKFSEAAAIFLQAPITVERIVL